MRRNPEVKTRDREMGLRRYGRGRWRGRRSSRGAGGTGSKQVREDWNIRKRIYVRIQAPGMLMEYAGLHRGFGT